MIRTDQKDGVATTALSNKGMKLTRSARATSAAALAAYPRR